MVGLALALASQPAGGCRPQAHRTLRHATPGRRASLAIRCDARAAAAVQTVTERMFERLGERAGGQQAAGAGGGTTYADLQRLDAGWLNLRSGRDPGPRPTFVRTSPQPLPQEADLDVIVAGGTLGIFLAAALQAAGLRVGVVERGALQGRAQEWNVSKKELLELVKLQVLDPADVEEAIAIEFNPVRVAFHGAEEVWTRDVLNLGVSPAALVAAARRRFEAAGGRVMERRSLQQVWVHSDGVAVEAWDSSGGVATLAAKLLIDCMGNQSPIVRQARHGQRPDGVCLVVGTCARGFDPGANRTGDIIATAAPSEPPLATTAADAHAAGGAAPALSNMQTFWEAFPAGSGPSDRTTYMFTYLDASPERPSLEAMLEHYWRAMPQYQGVKLEDLEVLRILFGVFTTYRDSPLASPFDRVLPVGDASGIQSPLSFGGFGALTRHLGRLTDAVVEAVQADALDRGSLAGINCYNPSLSGAWMLQRAMSVPAAAPRYDRDFINRLLGGNFAVMAKAGDPTLKPFLQDVIQAGPLARTLAGQMVADPAFVPQIMARVGPVALADWLRHFIALCWFTALAAGAEAAGASKAAGKLPPRQAFALRRAIEGWRYGAGLDYEL